MDLSPAIERARHEPQAPRLGGRLWLPKLGRVLPPGWRRADPASWRWEPPPSILPPLRTAVSVTTVTNGAANGANPSTAAFALSSSEVGWIAVMSYNGSGTGDVPAVPTITGWTEVTNIIISTNDFPFRCTVFRRVGAFASAAQTITTGSVQRTIWQVIKTSGCPVTGTNGSDAQAQFKSHTLGSGTGTSITATFDAGVTAGNAVLAFSFDWGAVTLTQRANFTQAYHVVDAAIGTLMTAYRISGETTAVSHTLGSAQHEGIIGVEVVASSSGLSATANQVTETDTAQAVGRRKSKAMTQPSETDTAQAVARLKSASTGLSSENDTALSLTARKTLAAGQATETDEALSLGRRKSLTLGMLEETGAALAVGRLKARAVAQAGELDGALAVTRALQALGIAAETDEALPVGRAKRKTLGLAVELDQARPLFRPGLEIGDVTGTLETVGALVSTLEMTGARISTIDTDGLRSTLEEVV